jgi:N-acetylmuramoyl-L-alanine amidase
MVSFDGLKSANPMTHKRHVVKEGECIASIAFAKNLLPDSIWLDEKNKELRELRKDPYVLLPGDVVYIRKPVPGAESCSTGKKHRFRRKGVPEKLVLEFQRNGEPRAHEPYFIDVDGNLIEGETDAQGRIEHAISPDAATARLVFIDTDEEIELTLGSLNPATEVSGIQSRLANLGYYAGPIDGISSSEYEEALIQFELDHPSAEGSGHPGDDPRDLVAKAHSGA